MSPRPRTADAVERALQSARERDGVISRRELRALGISRFGVRDQVRAGRWKTHGRQTVCVHAGPLSELGMRWRAIYEVGYRIAALDGVTALRAAGLAHLDGVGVDVSIPHGSRPLPVPGVWVHQVRRRPPSQLLTNGIPRVRPEIAAVRAAHWARSDRQAALILCMVVQQRIVTADALRRVVDQVGGRQRRAFVRVVIADLADGAQSLGELDFAAMCRRRGLPEPDRQAIRHGPNGRIYLDVRWSSIGLVVEIDGAQHRTGLALTDDNLRQNAVTLTGDVVLRVDLIGLRIRPDQFMDQVCQAHAQLTADRLSA